ncbi:ABC transporter ATP-binding protein [Paenibacillus turpanensis]|uniref:ABC transporter ATP-binding protein n=1 Tax=Paenibacillus turpanensis TaxID=2689078 RepID=UPI001409D960|nr:ABC transporter ATP-binding protein [Paenibacillus turpanensis]
MIAIETKQLAKTFGSVQVVKGINLTVKTGEIFGFLGRNGAGKSTFINMLTGIIRPTYGSYSLLGGDGASDEIKRRIGVMPDYSTFYSSLTALEHLKYFSALSGKPAGRDKCMQVLRRVGLEAHANKKSGSFSFGMKKKLGIAQALIHEPELIFLDEPTSGLDAESVIEVQHLIRELQKQGITIFMTSHNLDEVEKLCTTIAIMKEGQIIRIGTIEELRAFYRSSISVRIKHSPIPNSELANLRQFLESLGEDLSMTDAYLHISVNEEKKIAMMVRALNQMKIDIFRVDVEEPTLEEMFLEVQR